MKKTTINGPIYDARALGTPRMLVLGLQHMFAMFGATVLVPALTGLNVATALLFAGIGTLLFHLLTKGKVPAFLGSSFAFIGGYNAIRTVGTAADGSAIYNNALLPYACFGVLIAGLMYVILAALFKLFGVRNVVENRVDFTNTRNVIIAALILVLSIGISYSGSIQIGIVSLSGLAVASIVGIALNAVLPGKDYEFEQEHEGSTSVDLSGAINMEENQ